MLGLSFTKYIGQPVADQYRFPWRCPRCNGPASWSAEDTHKGMCRVTRLLATKGGSIWHCVSCSGPTDFDQTGIQHAEVT